MIAIKKIFTYLKGTPNLRFWYRKDTSFNLVGCSDAYYAGCTVDKKRNLEDVSSMTKIGFMV